MAKPRQWQYGLRLAHGEMRGPDEPTAWDTASTTLSPEDLTLWVRKWHRLRYVPEDALGALGLKECPEPWPPQGFPKVTLNVDRNKVG